MRQGALQHRVTEAVREPVDESVRADFQTVKRCGKDGRFSSEDCRYDAEREVYVCPAKQKLALTGSFSHKSGRVYHIYGSD